jgi:UDP-glucose 4-epimerase
MRALVTGGTGLVGRALVERLVAAGHEVVCMTRRPIVPARGAVSTVPGDLLRPQEVSFAKAGAIDAVFHLGAMLPTGGVSDAAYMVANAAGTAAVVEAGLKQGATRFVSLSSVSVYGAPSGGIIAHDTPPWPHTAYAVSKLAGEFCLALAERRGAIATSFRVSSIYGPGMSRTTVLPRLLDAALRRAPFGWFGAGTRAQDFIHASDVTEACMAAAGGKRSGTYILASGVSTGMKALAELIAAIVPGAEARQMGEHDPEDGLIRAYDIGVTQQAFRLPQPLPLADGLRDLIAAWSSAPEAGLWWQPC